MGDKIIGIKAVHEISRTRKAMNKHCTKVMLKSKDAGGVTKETETEEESVMDAKIIKSLAGLQARMGNAGTLYVSQLEDDKVKSFFEQEATAQDAEVKAWDEAEKAKAKEAEEAEKAKSAGDPEVEKLKSRIAELESTSTAEKAKARDLELKDIAKSQFPLVPQALTVLKSLEGLTDEQRKPTMDMLKSQQDLAKTLGTTVGDDDASENNATAKYDALVAETAKAKNITKSAAMVEIAENPEHAELVREHRNSMAG